MSVPVPEAPTVPMSRPDRAAAPWRRLLGPILLAVVVAAVVLAAIVNASRSAWVLLGAGRGLIPEEHYPLWAFVLIFATTIGQAVGWAGGSGIAYYVMTRVGLSPGAATWKLAASLVYLGLGALPLLVYHVAFGQPLLGLPRQAVAARLAADYPDAHLLLFRLHPVIDLSVIPLAAAFFALLYFAPPERSPASRYGLALVIVATSLAVALSLAIHSTFVHLRF